MAYFPDLSEYDYYRNDARPGTLNVGWLERPYEYCHEMPSEHVLDLLWTVCTVSVVQTRGRHLCDLCDPPALVSAERHGLQLALGSAEIRVFSKEGRLFAAPNLIYHYVNTHHYRPPDEFLCALHEGPVPPEDLYFTMLQKLDLEWNWTHKHKHDLKARKLVRHPDGRTEIKDIQIHTFHDRDTN